MVGQAHDCLPFADALLHIAETNAKSANIKDTSTFMLQMAAQAEMFVLEIAAQAETHAEVAAKLCMYASFGLQSSKHY